MHNMHSHSHPFPVSKPRPIHVLNQNLDSLMFWLHSFKCRCDGEKEYPREFMD